MALASGIYGIFLKDALINGKAFVLGAAGDTIKTSFMTDTHTNNFDTHDEYADVSANEVTGTGWAAAQALTTPVLNLSVTAGYVTFDADNISAATTTLTNVRGAITWDDTLAGDPLLHSVTFGADYSTVAGTFAVTWAATGLWRIAYR